MKHFYKILFLFGVTFSIWYLFAFFYQSPTVPSPIAVILNIGIESGNHLWIDLFYSGMRILIAMGFALVIGVPLGIFLGYNEKAHHWVSPFLYFSYPIPKMALLPIIMLLFGLGETSKLIMLFLIIFFPVVLDTIAGVKAMDKEMFNVLRTFGVSHGDICRKVILKGTLPKLFSTLKITTGIALSVLFFAENYGTTQGMGYYIMNSWQKMDYVDLYTGVLVLAILGFLLFCLFDYLERKLTPWK